MMDLGYSCQQKMTILRVTHRIGIAIGATRADTFARCLEQVPAGAVIEDIDFSEDGRLATISFREEKVEIETP